MVKFYDLQKINALYANDLKRAAAEVIDGGYFIWGSQLKKFESNLANYIGVQHAVGVGNGYDALYLILRAYIELGVLQAGDEVIVPANTFIATILAISANGLKPVLVDPDIRTYNLDISLIERNITERTKVIIIVHLYGRPCWSGELNVIANNHKLKIIEDNAQAFGCRYWWGSYTGSVGSAAACSFYPTKNLGALGDGGAVLTHSSALADMVRLLSNYGSEQKYVNEVKGVNSRLDELQAAFLNVKLKYVEDQNLIRSHIALNYHDNIRNDNVILPIYDKESVWHQFVIRINHRDELQKYLRDNDIETMIHYPIPPHKQLAYEEWKDISLPVTEQLSREVLSLPISPVMIPEEVDHVINTINRWTGR